MYAIHLHTKLYMYCIQRVFQIQFHFTHTHTQVHAWRHTWITCPAYRYCTCTDNQDKQKYIRKNCTQLHVQCMYCMKAKLPTCTVQEVLQVAIIVTCT